MLTESVIQFISLIKGCILAFVLEWGWFWGVLL